MADQDDIPSPASRADIFPPSERIDLDSVVDPSEVSVLDLKERMWRYIQPRRIAAGLVITGFGVTCYLLITEGMQSPAYTLFVTILSAALATLFGRDLDGPGST